MEEGQDHIVLCNFRSLEIPQIVKVNLRPPRRLLPRRAHRVITALLSAMTIKPSQTPDCKDYNLHVKIDDSD